MVNGKIDCLDHYIQQQADNKSIDVAIKDPLIQSNNSLILDKVLYVRKALRIVLGFYF